MVRSLTDINLPTLLNQSFHPSPVAWEDQVLYFLILDRFSNGRENDYLDIKGHPVTTGVTPHFHPGDTGNALQTEVDAVHWRDAGADWVGGTLKGLQSKIGYLKRLGITALWISPVFKQVPYQASYHGYGIQNFLEVDPHFGTREDFRQMVKTAHQNGIYVILDIILNHTGNIFGYNADRYWIQDPGTGQWRLDPRWDDQPYPVMGFRDRAGQPTLPFNRIDLQAHPDAWPDGAIWPVEFQDATFYTRKGRIHNWDYFPEFLEGDFYDLKDIHLGSGPVENYDPSPALQALSQVYQYWLAYADIDGYRIDTVKHMDPGSVRFFASVIHEFAQRLGKENFYLIGEITGGREHAFTTLELTGLDAALGIDDIPDKLEYLVKGYRNPVEYFDLFRNSMLVQKESHIWFRNKVVTLFDDHDQVRKGESKARFCAGDSRWSKLLLPVMALNVTTLGIPCIYYGSEQGFDGHGDNDRFLREAMFGGEFGAFGTRNRHFFNEETPVYQELAKLLTLRRDKITLRRGRQYLRMISSDGVHFGLPEMVGSEMRSVVPWSRLFDDMELLLAINTDPNHPRTAWCQVSEELHHPGDSLRCIYSTQGDQVGSEVTLEQHGETLAAQLTLPVAGFVIFE